MSAPPSATHGNSGPVDVLIVVMDCVRASEFPGGAKNPVSMPFAERLRRESVVFPQAISVAPWTLPSHASIFTGLYPWEHGCHGRGSLRLDSHVARLASVLAARGYATASISGNPIISPQYGMVDGFAYSAWGEWWEQVHRWRSTPTHSQRGGAAPVSTELAPLSFRDRTTRTLKLILQRIPATLALGDGIGRRIADPDNRWVGNLNPWIEPSLRSWLDGQPLQQPTYCFINLLDAHEPYLLDLVDAASIPEWWKSMRIAQDALAVLETPHLPTDDMARMHELYRRSIEVIDRRLERIVSIYRDAGRWDRTLLVLTSDHGQAFGEHGMVWHGISTEEEMLRVPLWVRFPHADRGGSVGRGWATPMDAAPTILRAAGAPSDLPNSGATLQDLIDSDRPSPLLSAGDGTEWNRPLMAHLSPQRQSELNVFSVVAYLGATKIVVDPVSGSVRGLDLSTDPPSPLSESRLSDPTLAPVIEAARHAGALLMNPSPSGVTEEVDERLRSWGYG